MRLHAPDLPRRWLRRATIATPAWGGASADDRAMALALAMPTMIVVLTWCITRAQLRLGWTVVLPPAPDWQVGAALLLATSVALAAPLLGAGALRRWPRAGRLLPWSIGALAMTYASWAAGPVSLAVGMAAGLRGRVRGPTALGVVAASVFWASDMSVDGFRTVPALGWTLWALVLWRLDARRGTEGPRWIWPATLALWLAGVAVGLRLLPWSEMTPVVQVLVLFLVVLPTVLVPGMIATTRTARALLERASRKPVRAAGAGLPAALAATLAVGLVTSVATSVALVVALERMPSWAGGVLVAPGPAIIAARLDPMGHLWVLAIAMLPVLPVVMAAATAGNTVNLAARQAGLPAPVAVLASIAPPVAVALIATVAGLSGAPLVLWLLEPLAR